MKIGDILRDAAAFIERGEESYSCFAICKAAGIKNNTKGLYAHPAGAVYAAFFGGQFPLVIEMHQDADGSVDRIDEVLAANNRVMALCMAAAIADDGNEDRAASPASSRGLHPQAAAISSAGSFAITPKMLMAGAAVLDLYAASSPSRLELIAGEVFAAMAACAAQQRVPKRSYILDKDTCQGQSSARQAG